MYREHEKSINDIYENDFVINGKFGRKIMDSNATRVQSSELTGTTHTGARQRKTDDLYENADVIRSKITMKIKDSNTTRIQSSEHTGSDSMKIRNYRAAVVCLVLLCVLLLTAVIVLCVTLTQERQQFKCNIENLTNERDQLILENANLTDERDQLILKNTSLTNQRFQLIFNTNLTIRKIQQRNELQVPVGWTYYQSSFYYISNETRNWTESRRYCTERGADLIVINNSEEQDLVKNISGDAAVYIGLTDTAEEGTWKWVDGSNMTSGFSSWAHGQPNGDNRVYEDCAVTVAVPWSEFLNLVGWLDIACNRAFRWICEKRTSQFILP